MATTPGPMPSTTIRHGGAGAQRRRRRVIAHAVHKRVGADEALARREGDGASGRVNDVHCSPDHVAPNCVAIWVLSRLSKFWSVLQRKQSVFPVAMQKEATRGRQTTLNRVYPPCASIEKSMLSIGGK